ncbi:hypothetical protein RhiirA5_422817 [Rhizophagus irregularis]|uniref:Uncharacterized protein n=1 Tax=Rhizophagus irregularis TaxID=588596 RepID=A0A2N0PB47_9GLOM|nr:hypothetical protein RhiirA5_422817 [Rhizophagus irregularis]
MSDTPVSTTSLQNFELVEEDLEIIRKQRVNGRTFFKITKDELERHGMKLGPATTLVEFAKECKERKLRAFSSYKTKKDLSEVLRKYGIDGNGIGAISQFPPKTYSLENEDKELKQCIRELKRRLSNMGSVVADSNEAMRFIGEESTSHVDYAIKALEELICITEGKSYQVNISFAQNLIQCESALQVNKKKRKTLEDNFDYIYGIVTTATEWYFILYTTGKISCTSQDPLNIRLVRSALNENSEAEKELCKNVKRVMEVIVGLLKDRLEVEREPSKKKKRVQGYFEKQEI